MAELARTASLTGYLAVMQSLGVDPRPLLREVGFSADLLADPDQYISTRALRQLLERSAEVTGCATLGLRMAEKRAISDLGVSSLVLAHEPTLGCVLKALGESLGRINSNLVLQVTEFDQEVELRQAFSLDGPKSTRQASDLRTGDLGRVDEDGYFFMTDRLKRMINASGYKVWPAEVEALMYRHPAILESCVISARDVKRGETVKALVVLRPGQAATESEIAAWCHERMATYKAPRIVEFVASLPKSGSGKVAWRALQEAENSRSAD